MSDASEKPFEATSRRIAKAKREGNVARAGEFAANLAFIAAGLAVVALAPLLGAAASAALICGLTGTASTEAAALIVAVALVPVGCAALAGAMANLIQNGGLTLVAIAPKFERLNPVEGVKRIFSRETLAHSLRASLAFAVAAAAMAPAVIWNASALIGAATIAQAAGGSWKAVQQVSFAAVAVGSLFSIAEYNAARSAWMRRLRMSLEERRREAKEEEGDAVARGRRRSLHRAFVRSGLARVKEAAFVVVNPTHVAVALEYRPPVIDVPRVIVRASDAAALHVRRIAAEHCVPIVENVPLAHALYRDARAGESIPRVYYVAVAEIVAALLRSEATAR